MLVDALASARGGVVVANAPGVRKWVSTSGATIIKYFGDYNFSDKYI